MMGKTIKVIVNDEAFSANCGDLLLDDRISAAVVTDLTERGHHTSLRSRYANGAAPVMIKVLPSAIIEAGADPFYNRSAHAW